MLRVQSVLQVVRLSGEKHRRGIRAADALGGGAIGRKPKCAGKWQERE
jgi:hypothetical protein